MALKIWDVVRAKIYFFIDPPRAVDLGVKEEVAELYLQNFSNIYRPCNWPRCGRITLKSESPIPTLNPPFSPFLGCRRIEKRYESAIFSYLTCLMIYAHLDLIQRDFVLMVLPRAI